MTQDQAEKFMRAFEKRKFQEMANNTQPLPTKLNANEFFGVERGVGITCPECKQKNVSYILRAVRSADEGMTAFYTCKCGWQTRKN